MDQIPHTTLFIPCSLSSVCLVVCAPLWSTLPTYHMWQFTYLSLSVTMHAMIPAKNSMDSSRAVCGRKGIQMREKRMNSKWVYLNSFVGTGLFLDFKRIQIHLVFLSAAAMMVRQSRRAMLLIAWFDAPWNSFLRISTTDGRDIYLQSSRGRQRHRRPTILRYHISPFCRIILWPKIASFFGREYTNHRSGK